MKHYSISFFFPTQPGGRQEAVVREQGSNPGIALARAWRQVKHMPKYKGRKGLDNFRVGVVLIPETPNVVEESTYPDYDAINNTPA